PAFERVRCLITPRAPADQAIVGRQLDQGGVAAAPGTAGRPGGTNWGGELRTAQVNDLKIINLQGAAIVRLQVTSRRSDSCRQSQPREGKLMKLETFSYSAS